MPAVLVFLLMCLSCMAKESIKIGVSLGLTGKYAFTSNKQRNAYQLWQVETNKKGGIRGRQVEFVFMDNASTAEKAKQQYTALIEREKVDFVIGPYSSSLTLAIAPIVEKHGYPTLAAGAAADEIWQQGYKNVFGMWTPGSRYALGFLKLLVIEHMDRIAVIHEDDAFGRATAAGVKQWAKVLRLKIVDFEKIDMKRQDLSATAERLAKVKPDAVLCMGHYDFGEGMKKALLKVGWHPKVFFATVAPAYQQYYSDLDKAAERDFSVAIWEPHPKLRFPGSLSFIKRYEERYAGKPTYHAASAYAACETLAKAIAEARSLDRAKVRTALQNLNTTTVIGRYAVDKNGVQIKRFPLIIQWQDGQKEIVWPLGLRTAKPRFK